MKLETRRKIRQAWLEWPAGAWHVLGLLFALIGGIGFYVDESEVILLGIVGAIGVFWLRTSSAEDACPTCNSKVDALSDRYCDVCGHRLDDLEAAPPIEKRVSERFRPVNLEELEAGQNAVQATDGGHIEDDERTDEPEGQS